MKRLLPGLLGLVVLLVIAGAAALLLVDANRFRPQVQASLGRALGREVSIGQLHAALWSGALSADDIRIADDPAFGRAPFVSARSLAVGVRLWPLLVRRQLHITSLTLRQPQVRLLQDKRGRWNFASLGAGAPAAATSAGGTPDFHIDHLRLADGTVELRQSGGDVHRYRQVTASADDVGLGHPFAFAAGASVPGEGTVKLSGKVGPWHAGDALLTPLEGHLLMHHLDLVAAGLMGPDAGVGGVIDVDTRLVARNGVLRSKGRLVAHGLQLVKAGSPAPRPVTVDYQASYRLVGGTGRIENATIGSGGAHIRTRGSFDARPAIMRLDLHLAGQRLPVDDVQPLLPAIGVVLPKDSRLSGGRAGLELTARGPLDALVIAGPVTLDDSRLAGYSLGEKLGSALALAGIAAPKDTVIRHAEATLRLDPSGLVANPLRAVIAGLGSVAGTGRMAADGRLDARLLVKLDNAVAGGKGGQGLSGLLGGSKAGRALGGVLGGVGSQGVGVRVAGTASAPSFRLDPASARQLLKAGLAGEAKPAPPGSGPAPPAKDNRLLESLLKGALTPKKPPAGN